jgi:hypothetical protein
VHDVADAQAGEIAATQLAVDGEVEHGEAANRVRILEVNSDRADVLRLEGRLLADQLPLVPSFAFDDGFDIRLLGC